VEENQWERQLKLTNLVLDIVLHWVLEEVLELFQKIKD
jgi:hypothetical protein